MNILVVNPPNKPFTNKSILAEPIDVLQIATIIKRQFNNVKVLDMDVNQMDNNINSFLETENIVIFILDYQLPLHTSDSMNNIFEIIKNFDKKTTTIMIGKTSSYYYKKILNANVDIIIDGIAGYIINNVIDNIINNKELKSIPNIIYRKDNEIIITNKVKINYNYSSLPIPNREFLDINKYMDTRTLVSSRGCIGKCSFCTTPTFFGMWSGRDESSVVDEIEYLINTYKTKKIIFLDDNATVNKKRMYEICKEIKKRNIKCLFGCLSSINCYDKNLFKEMYNCGFRWIHFGIESGSNKILNLMNKKIDTDYMIQVINEVKNTGFRVRASIILDYPGSTKEDINLTRKLIRKIEPHELRLHYLAYRVGTQVFDANKDIKNNTQYIHSNHPNVENKDLTSEINLLIKDLKNNGYKMINENIDWNIYNNLSINTKLASFVPIKYGMCWYE